MAKKVETMSIASAALVKYNEAATFKEALFTINTSLRGKIIQIRWHKQSHGLLELTNLEFADTSQLQISKFIRPDGRANISLRVTS